MTEPHATLVKFGYPGTLIRAYGHWRVLLRQQQVTLGALVLCAAGEEQSFAALPREAYTELHAVARDCEAALNAFRPFDRINYLMLMMVDPQVHFHVLPRYSEAQEFEGQRFEDAGWPGPPDLKGGVKADAAFEAKLLHALKAVWPK